MRLQEVYYICKDAAKAWPEPTFEEKRAAGGGVFYVLKNTAPVVETLNKLDEAAFLAERIEKVRTTAIRFRQLDGIATFDGSAKTAFSKEFSELKVGVKTVVDMFGAMNYAQNTNGFDIKLPPNMSLADLSKCAKDLDTIFKQCPILARQDGDIALTDVDVGSIWLTFAIVGGSVAILKGIAELVDKAMIVRSHYLTTKTQMEAARGLKIANDIIEQQKNVSETVSKALLEKVASELADKHTISAPEEIEHVKHSIDLLANWMSKGMEIYAAIQAPPDVKAVFSPIEKQALPEETMRLLAEHDERSENTD